MRLVALKGSVHDGFWYIPAFNGVGDELPGILNESTRQFLDLDNLNCFGGVFTLRWLMSKIPPSWSFRTCMKTLHRSQKISQCFWKYYQQHAWPLYSVFYWIGPSELIEILSWLTQSGLPNWLHLFLRFILRAFEKRLEILKMHPSYLSHTSLLFWMPHLFTLWPLHTKKHLTVGWVM